MSLRLVGLGRELVRRYPGVADAHFQLGLGLNQVPKDAWEPEGKARVEQYWALALEEFREASRLDGENVKIRDEVKDLGARLAALRAPGIRSVSTAEGVRGASGEAD